MEANKVADNPILGEDDTFRAIQNNGKIWLFQEKYEDQLEYRYGHRTLIAGSSVTNFNLETNKWDVNGFKELPSLSNESHKLDELLFTFAGSIFMLLFNRFEGLNIESLWKFDEERVEWSKHSEISEVIEKPTGDNTFGSKLLIVGGDQTNDGSYFVAKISTSEGSSFALLKLKINESNSSINVLNKIENLHSILPAMDPLPFAAIRVNQNVYISLAERGCGYRWRTEDLLRINTEDNKLDTVQVNNENPSFGLMVASENHYDKTTDSWIYFGSLSKVGGFHLPASEQTPETRFYKIENLTSEPVWKESNLVIVDPGRDDIYVPIENNVYVISRKQGTLKIQFGEFHSIKSRKEEL